MSQESLSEEDVFSWYWSDTHHGREVSVHNDKRTLTFHPSSSNYSTAIRGTKILSKNMEHYFEVEMQSPFFGQARQVGLGTSLTALESNSLDFSPILGKDHGSWGLNYDGYKYHSGSKEKYVSIDPDKFDILQVGVLYDSYYGTLSFRYNGKWCGVAFEHVITNLDLYPMLCSSSAKSVMKLTHCSSSVMSLKALCRGVVRMNIAQDKGYEELDVPNHIKAYLTHRSPKSKSGSRKSEKNSIEDHSCANGSIESTI